MRSKQPGNIPYALNDEYYAQRASAGLIISEATQVTPEGQGYPYTPGIHSPEQVEGWKLVTDAVHQEGGRIFLQLWHVGRISHPDLQPNGALPVAPSAIAPKGEASTFENKKYDISNLSHHLMVEGIVTSLTLKLQWLMKIKTRSKLLQKL